MIIEISYKDKEKVLKLLKDNGIDYEKANRLSDMLIKRDVEDMLDAEFDYDDEKRIGTLSEKEIYELTEYVSDSIDNYDYSYYNDFIRECMYEWLDNERRK
ncbi:MAG: hypothetical protein MSA56_11125 [Clostridium sp.]|nr:hypothetical protein [Clostridium sp.]